MKNLVFLSDASLDAIRENRMAYNGISNDAQVHLGFKMFITKSMLVQVNISVLYIMPM